MLATNGLGYLWPGLWLIEHGTNYLYSKKQSTITTSVFGAEFVAMEAGVETLHITQYKLRMMDIPMSGASYIYGDNMSVIHNNSKPESALKKMCNAIAYHAVGKSVAMGESLTVNVRSEDNVVDLFTKLVIGEKRNHLVSLLLCDIYDGDT